MVKGDMCLNIIEKGKPKDVIIKEGEVFDTTIIMNVSEYNLVKT